MDESKKMTKKTLNKGFFLALTASITWGVSGAVQQIVAKDAAIPAMWFVGIRTLIAGIILLAVALFVVPKKEFFSIFKSWKDTLILLAFSIFGLWANMYTFFYAIKLGNSSTATILQYLSPLFIMLASVLFFHKKVLRIDVISFSLALIGVVLLITRGDFGHLAIPMSAVIWGIGTGITAALYIVIPQQLISKHSGILVTGWGMLFAGIFSTFFRPFWVNPPHVSGKGLMGIAAVILLSNVIAFLLMVLSTKYTTAATISITDAVQPFTTLILSVLFLAYAVNLVEIIGGIIVVVAVYLLNRYDANTK
ncbi:DMT family transporter [Companilactobacillus mishanensis]|uniref:EamA family transporter n=1 Tax=Companilactobacillus mishanensis TaxID=2486008 RepID=A0A5P0ZJY8_9LACO|nr:DMT family transporter [Companilactobacillus mishanensis]MQS45563.1 EamA family transporter [Companilactobacillus mishanensis]MQS53403.1 EamA family transporter [Companilactobacillus mishanensis]